VSSATVALAPNSRYKASVRLRAPRTR
jgi:hypothetical protein